MKSELLFIKAMTDQNSSTGENNPVPALIHDLDDLDKHFEKALSKFARIVSTREGGSAVLPDHLKSVDEVPDFALIEKG